VTLFPSADVFRRKIIKLKHYVVGDKFYEICAIKAFITVAAKINSACSVLMKHLMKKNNC